MLIIYAHCEFVRYDSDMPKRVTLVLGDEMSEFQQEYKAARRRGYSREIAAILAEWMAQGEPDF